MIPIAVASGFIADSAPVAIDREMTQIICGYVHVSTRREVAMMHGSRSEKKYSNEQQQTGEQRNSPTTRAYGIR